MKPIDNKIIRVKFVNSHQLYSYICPYSVSVGDHVVVDTPFKGYTVVVVKEVGVEDVKATKYVVSVIDDRPYKDLLEKENRIKELKKELEVHRKAVEESMLLDFLAKKSPSAKKLIQELNDLTGNS